VILSYARDALTTVIARIDRLYQIVKPPDMKLPIAVVVDAEVPPLLTDLIYHQGLASLLLFNDSPKSRSENGAAYKSRTERAAYVKERCKKISTQLLSNRKVRNSLTHLDEYLVKELARENTGWFIDVVVVRRNEFKPQRAVNVRYCRSYIMEEDVLLHFDNEIKLSALKEECENVLKAVWRDDDVGYYSGPPLRPWGRPQHLTAIPSSNQGIGSLSRD
jgi:hypothetical protein